MSDINYKDLERAYRQAMEGVSIGPTTMYTPDGIFVRRNDGTTAVFGYGVCGDTVALSEEDQQKAIESFQRRLEQCRNSLKKS